MSYKNIIHYISLITFLNESCRRISVWFHPCNYSCDIVALSTDGLERKHVDRFSADVIPSQDGLQFYSRLHLGMIWMFLS